jgi:hypothetical protein
MAWDAICPDILTADGFMNIPSLVRLETIPQTLTRTFFLRDVLLVAQSLARAVNSKDILSNGKNWTRVIRRRGQVTCPSIHAIRTLLQGSPKVRAMLPITIHNSLVRGEKQIVWCSFPVNQIYVSSVLKECGIDAKNFHSKLGSGQRDALITEFTSSSKCSVLIVSFAVNVLGLNLQARCNIMHFLTFHQTKRS